MSLLLDALKKAAEQKAQKSKPEVPENRSSDETLLDGEAVDDTARLAGDDRMRPAGREDETILEQTEIEERLARGERIPGDDTSVDLDDSTQTHTHVESDARTAAESDDTGIDTSDATQTLLVDEQPEQAASDDTRIDIPDTTETQLVDEQTSFDDTGIDIPDTTETVVEQAQADETVFDETGTDIAETTATVLAEEQSQSLGSEDATGVDTTGSSASAGSVASDPDHDTDDDTTSNAADFNDEDLSLMLQEPDPTNTGVTTGFTDPQIPAERARTVPTPGDSELALADITQDRARADQTETQGQTLTNRTATVLHGDDTRTAPNQTNLTRSDGTSTRTYAPDNYDRTLMKLPSDDASKLFAGMKSDADVVMTPDYAKKVFQSKNATQRTRHYRTYLGIGLILFGLVAGYSVMEYEDESTQIENSLRPLKFDPMPGVIKAEKEPEIDLFGESSGQVDSRTIEIIAAAADGVVASEPEVEVEPVVAVEVETVADDTAVAMIEPTGAPSNPPQSNATDIEENTGSGDAMTSTTNAQGNLNIKSSSQYRQSDIWLREAYEAYRAGNNDLAMQRYSEVLRLDPGSRDALLGRAAINVQNGSIDAAIRDYQTLLLINPKDSLAMSSLLAVASYSPQETESQLKLMLQDEPDSPYLNFALANAYGAQDRWKEAQGHYFKALQNNPGDPNYAYNLAVSLEHIAQPSSAVNYYQRALDNIGNGLATFNREVVGQRLEALGKL